MKTSLLICAAFFVCLGATIFAADAPEPTKQIFRDAVIVTNALSANDKATVNRVFAEHKVSLDTNPFLGPLASRGLTAQTAAPPVAGGIATAIGPFDFTKVVVDVLTQKMVEGVKKDLLFILLQQIRDNLQTNVETSTRFGKDVQILFPRAVPQLLKATDSELASGQVAVPLADVARADLETLPEHLDTLIAGHYNDAEVINVQRYMVHVLTRAGADIVTKKPQGVMIDNLQINGHAYAVDGDANAKTADAAVTLADIVSHMLILAGNKDKWVPFSEVQQSLNNLSGDEKVVFAQVLLGLSYAHDENLYEIVAKDLGDPTLFKSLMAREHSDQFKNLVAIIGAFSDALSRLQDDAQRLADIKSNVTLSDIASVGEHLQRFLTLAQKINTVIPELKLDLNFGAGVEKVTAVAELVVAARTKDYHVLVLDLVQVLPVFVPAEARTPSKPKSGSSGVQLLPASVPTEAATDLVTWLNGKPGQLIVGLANAKSDDEARAVLINLLTSDVTFIDKQHFSVSYDLTGYFGGTIGIEHLAGDTGTAKASAFRAGLSAPIGVGITWGDAQPKGRRGSWSAFASIIDLGALVSYRFGNGSTSTLPPVKWSTIVAPGLFAVYEFKNLPVNLMVGVQYGPELRSVKSGTATLERAAWQAPAVAITFDVPLFHFAHR